MRWLYTKNLIFLLLFSSSLFAQDIVLSLKPEFQAYLSGNTIANKRLKSLFDAMNVQKTESILKIKHAKATSLDRTYSLFLADNQHKNAVATALLQSGYFEYVQARETKTIAPLYLPNDPFAQPSTGSQYYLEKINAYKAWDISKGDTNVVVCIVDNGIEATHPEFQNKIKYNAADPVDGIDNDKDGYVDNYMGWDIANDDAIPEDTTGSVAHGTEVSALAVGLTNNGIGIASVGYNCKFIPVKIFNNTNASGTKAYEAVIYAAQHGCKVINMSWGSVGGFDQFEQAVINYAAIDNDAVLVGATYPKEGDMVFTTPADYENVLSVAAIRPNDLKAIPQATHYWIDLSAPSIDVFTANIKGGYRYNSGVSLGVPLVTGAAALARSVYPKLNSTQIQELLRVTTTNIDTIGTNKNYKEKMGHGRLDVYKALTDSSTPAIRISEYSLHALNGDTVSLELGFKNYLWPSKKLKFDFRQLNGGFEIYDSTTSVGIVEMGDSAATLLGGIKFRILPFTSANSSELIRIGISDTANHYTDYHYFYLDKKSVIPKLITKSEVPSLISEEFKLFPNPCNENLFIEFENAEEVSIAELTGKKLAVFDKPSEIVAINMKDWSSGVYLANVRTLNGSFTKKFLKK